MSALVPALIELFLKARRRGGGGGYGGYGGGRYGGGGYGRAPKPQLSQEEQSMKYLNLQALKEGIDEKEARGSALSGLLNELDDFDPVSIYNSGMGAGQK